MNDLQTVQLNIILSIDELCRSSNICYYLAGGSALGAARHKGFIPWDDDIDILMKEEDYRRFLKAFRESCCSDLVLQESYVNSEYYAFSKVRKKGTTQIESEQDRTSAKMQGVFIDIFPLRKCSTKRLSQYFQYLCEQYLTLCGQVEQGWQGKTNKQKMTMRLLKIAPNKALFRMANNYVKRVESKTKDYKYCFFEIGRGLKWENLVFENSMFSIPEYVPFECATLPVPSDNNGYLTQYYGDYMTPPPLDKRMQFRHGIYVDTQKDFSKYLCGVKKSKQKEMMWVEYYPQSKNGNEV